MFRRIVVLGGTGFVGRAFAARCAGAGLQWQLVVPTRRLAHGDGLRPMPRLELLEADVHDPGTLERLFAGAEAVVNLVAILHGNAAQFEAVHVELPRRIAAAMRATGLRRLVHVSALGVGDDAPSMYLRSKTAGEAVLRSAGLDLTILRPSTIFGIEDRFLNLFAQLQSVVPVMALPGAEVTFEPVWVRDVASVLLRCLEDRATIGKTYELTGPQVFTLAELVRKAGARRGHARPIVPMPAALARAQAWLFEHLPGPTLLSRDNLRSMERPSVATGTCPGMAELGLTPSSIDAAWAQEDPAGAAAVELQNWRRLHGGR
ncbi:MAG: complex I NDUFA9 subunit family protein [Burkholderiaceae bacterium]|nr:complex I NDUFA9 subunit family protein [Burkholderiaceae bacterium]